MRGTGRGRGFSSLQLQRKRAFEPYMEVFTEAELSCVSADWLTEETNTTCNVDKFGRGGF